MCLVPCTFNPGFLLSSGHIVFSLPPFWSTRLHLLSYTIKLHISCFTTNLLTILHFVFLAALHLPLHSLLITLSSNHVLECVSLLAILLELRAIGCMISTRSMYLSVKMWFSWIYFSLSLSSTYKQSHRPFSKLVLLVSSLDIPTSFDHPNVS